MYEGRREAYFKNLSLIAPYKYVKFHKWRCFSWSPRILWNFLESLFFSFFTPSVFFFLSQALNVSSCLVCGILVLTEDNKKACPSWWGDNQGSQSLPHNPSRANHMEKKCLKGEWDHQKKLGGGISNLAEIWRIHKIGGWHSRQWGQPLQRCGMKWNHCEVGKWWAVHYF